MSERKDTDYLKYLNLDEDDIVVRIRDQVIKQRARGQIDKWNRDGKIYVNKRQFMHPESCREINRRLSQTGFQYDPEDVPSPREYVPPFEHINEPSEVDQTKVRLPDVLGRPVVTNIVTVSERRLGTNNEDLLREERHKLLKIREDFMQNEQELKRLRQECMEKTQYLKKLGEDKIKEEQCLKTLTEKCIQMEQCLETLKEEYMQRIKKLVDYQNEIELAMHEMDIRTKTLDDLIQETEQQLMRKQETYEQKRLTLIELEKLPREPGSGYLDPSSSRFQEVQGYGAGSRSESTLLPGPRMEGTNNTQVVINGNNYGTFNQSSNIYFAIIIALFCYLMHRC